MARLDDKDRQFLGDAGLELSDSDYISAVAGLGIAGLARRVRLRAGPVAILWSPVFEPGFASRRPSDWRPQDLRGFIQKWEDVQKETPQPRVIAQHSSVWGDQLDAFALFRILGAPEARTSSVFVETHPPQADLRFQMPMRVGAWPDDYDALGLAAVGGQRPISQFTQFRPLSREHARCDVLILRGTLRMALQRILAAPFAVRAAFIVLVGPSDAPWQRVRNLAESLLAETQAAGLSVITPRSTGEIASRLINWLFQFAHNEPIDVGLKVAFQDTAALHLLSLNLIEAASLPAAARVLSRRIDVLPRADTFSLQGQPTLSRIGLDDLQALPAAVLATGLARTLRERADTLPYFREREGATALSEISVAERQARQADMAIEPNRFLQADIFAIREGQAIRHERPFVINRPHRVELFIGPPGGGALQADEAFPDKTLDWQNADQFTLGVIFSEPDQWSSPQTGELILARYGTSTRCRFDFTPTRAGPFRARVTIHYRGRVLQTALLEGKVEASGQVAADTVEGAPRLSVEAQIYNSLTSLDDRRRFDANLVMNHTVTGRPTIQAAGREGAIVRSLGDINQQLEAISGRLRDIANQANLYSRGLYSDECTAMLIKLATHGEELYGRLVVDYIDASSVGEELRKSRYLQIVTATPEAVVPLELIYEYAPPADNAKVCPKALEALDKGCCPSDCDTTTSPARHVCPMGFWGLRKVIERHAHDPDLAKGDAFIEGVDPVGARRVIPLKGAALLAASKNVTDDARKVLEKDVIEQWKTAGAVKSVRKWSEWKKAIGDVDPITLLMALPHSSGAKEDISLEISGDTLKTRFITRDYLQPAKDKPAPLVLLLGCDTSGTGNAKTYTRHVTNFRRRGGAQVILGTLAVIDNADAASAAAIFAEQLVKVLSKKPDYFGEVLRQTKREAMKKGLLMVLGLVGFGDADWQLKL